MSWSHPQNKQEMSMNRYRVTSGAKINLSDWDPNDTSYFKGGKDAAKERLKELNKELEKLQELLHAEHRHKLLVVLQGMDTSGKDGVIRHVFEGVNPKGVEVVSFGAPTTAELDHDYLWRVHARTPAKGEIVIFNRSHYEDVLVVRVKGLVTEQIWSRRFEHINQFEHMLADEGTIILKFFLHIDRKEQKERLQARLDEPHKRWKFRKGDLEDRKLWPQYTRAYDDVISRTGTAWAPWYIIPSNRKWYRNLLIGSVIVDRLRGLDMRYPQPEEDLDDIVIES
jgi:PPK2 family polyphosphate:nucleotide phosphotransferase